MNELDRVLSDAVAAEHRAFRGGDGPAMPPA